MKKNVLLILIGVFLLSVMPSALAGYGYDGCGMMGGAGWFGMELLIMVYIAFGSFIFATIFWLTYNWLVVSEKKGKK